MQDSDFKWYEGFKMGIASLDQKHRKSFELSRKFLDGLMKREGENAAADYLDSMPSHIADLFSVEESYMRKLGFPNFERHRTEHDKFRQVLCDLDLRRQTRGVIPRFVRELSLIVLDYLNQHMRGKDRELSEFIIAAMSQRKARILITDDSPDIRDLMMEQIGLSGHVPVMAENGKEALELIRRDPPDMMFLDINMPVMNGIEFLKAVRQEGLIGEIPIVMLTSHAETDIVKGCLALGARDYLLKPFRAANVTDRLGKWLVDFPPQPVAAPAK